MHNFRYYQFRKVVKYDNSICIRIRPYSYIVRFDKDRCVVSKKINGKTHHWEWYRSKQSNKSSIFFYKKIENRHNDMCYFRICNFIPDLNFEFLLSLTKIERVDLNA